MTEPYSPSNSIRARLGRRLVRIRARAPSPLNAPRAIVSFTFDDFPKSAAEAGAAALERHNMHATYYAAAGFAGQENHFGPLFDPSDLKRLTAAGHEIGCHTNSHLDCSTASPDAVIADVATNARALAAMGHDAALESFAFPYGEASAQTKQRLMARFSSLRSVWPGVNRGQVDRAFLRSTAIEGGEAGVANALRHLDQAVQSGGWLIFYTHDVCDAPSEWGCTAEELDRVARAVANADVDVLTVGEATRSALQLVA